MSLSTVTDVRRPASLEETGDGHPGCAWPAGGTWLFSEPQMGVALALIACGPPTGHRTGAALHLLPDGTHHRAAGSTETRAAP